MPGLVNARVCNARFNGGKKYYEDLHLRSHGDALVIDMVNGGGKSFLIQCIGQTIIPNSKWQNDWDFKAVFEPKNKNTVIHCASEWELDEGSEYKYLLAGFCASKALRNSSDDEEKTYADFERFSYICLYNERNENDIFNLPLKEETDDGRSKFISLSDLKKYLYSIKTGNYYTEVFTTAKSYRERLSQYNITKAEWELIKDVNADEKYVATYLRQYPNAEKFILDFLIPKIEECYSTRTGYEYQDSDKLASSLLNIREKMDELMKSKAKSQEYDKVIESIQKLADKLNDLSDKYVSREELYIEIKKSLIFIEEELSHLTDKRNSTKSSLNDIKKDISELDINIQGLEIKNIENFLNKKIREEKIKESEIKILSDSLEREKRNFTFKVQENTYHSILQDESSISRCNASIETLELNNKELVSERNSLGLEVKSHLQNKLEIIKDNKKKNDSNIEECKNEIDKYFDSKINKQSEIISLNKENEKLMKEKESISKKLASQDFKVIQNIDKDIYAKRRLEDELEENKVIINELRKDVVSIEQQINDAKSNTNLLKIEKAKLDKEYEIENEKLEQIASMYNKCESLFDIYDCSSVEELYNKLSLKIKRNQEDLNILNKEMANCKSIISTLKNHKIELSKDTNVVYNIIKNRYPNALLGIDFISSLDIKDKEYFIKMNSLIPYSVLMEDNDYRKFIDNKEILDNYYGSAVPVISKKTLEEVIIYPNGLTFTSKDIEFYTNEEKIVRLRLEKEEELKDIVAKVEQVESALKSASFDMKPVSKFIEKNGNKSTLENMALKVRRIEELLEENDKSIDIFNKLEISLKVDSISITENIKNIESTISEKSCQLDSLKLYLDLKDRVNNIDEEFSKNSILINEISKALKTEQDYIGQLKIRRAEYESLVESFIKQEYSIIMEIKDINFIKETNSNSILTEEEYLAKKNRLKAILDKLQGSNSDLKQLNDEIDRCKERIENNSAAIAREMFSVNDFAHITMDFVKNSDELLKKLRNYVTSLEKQLNDLKSELVAIIASKGELKGNLTSRITSLKEKNYVDYDNIKDNIDKLLNGLSYLDRIKHMKGIMKENKATQLSLEKSLKELDSRISSSNDTKNKFIQLDKEIDVKLDDKKLDNIRNPQDVSTEIKVVENSIRYKTNEFKRDVAIGKNTVTSIQGYLEILKDLEEIPTVSLYLKEVVNKLVGDNEDTWISMLRYEQEKIEETIKSLELQEDKFITLCIQKSENILRDIKKLTELSVIEINSRRQEMLRINLNKLPDDLAREKMKKYIEGVIMSCSEESDDSVRRRKISKGLTPDNLFKQIIDRIKNKSVELYKLEDIDNVEVNEWLSLDRAYGSKGETNGMYISMLICIISYLRKLYTNSTDESKKVIILDNPFSGTTSEIIWLPILNLLKENNVQLWAVGFEIKTQLANVFPTRYYMGKKASKQYEKIIINRFHSDYNLKSLGYDELYGRKMNIKQIAMDID